MAGRIKLVMLPGLDGTGHLFSSLLGALPADLEPVIISYPTGLILGFEQIVSYVEDRLPRSPFVLLGESFSGPVAITIAARKNINIKGLILVATFARSPIPRLSLPLFTILQRVFTFSPTPPGWAIRFFMLSGLKLPAIEDDLTKALLSVESHVLVSRLEILKNVNVEDCLRKIPGEVCYLLPSKDRLVSKAHRESMTHLNPRLQIYPVQGPHLLLQTSAKSCAARVMEFVKKGLA